MSEIGIIDKMCIGSILLSFILLGISSVTYIPFILIFAPVILCYFILIFCGAAIENIDNGYGGWFIWGNIDTKGIILSSKSNLNDIKDKIDVTKYKLIK